MENTAQRVLPQHEFRRSRSCCLITPPLSSLPTQALSTLDSEQGGGQDGQLVWKAGKNSFVPVYPLLKGGRGKTAVMLNPGVPSPPG